MFFDAERSCDKLLRIQEQHLRVEAPKMLPAYIAKAIPRPRESRAPWYSNTAPAYAGVFLWIGFYQSIATGTLDRMSLSLCLFALVLAAALCFALYYASAMLGMKTGLPLYV